MIEERRLEGLPTAPGVYLFRDAEGGILYIGKAKSLRTRVRSYFRVDRHRGIRLQELARLAMEVETIVVDSEAEALLLEANLIKEHKPRFNIRLRDDKRFPYVKVTVQEPFPRVWVTRSVREDGARYFGPFTQVRPLRRALEHLTRTHGIRSCRYRLLKEAPPRPCLDYHIGRCAAPCVGLQSQEAYRDRVRELVAILDGDTADLIREMEARMREAAREQRFEEAARLRDIAIGLGHLAREQRVERVDGGDEDVIGIARDGEEGVVVVLRIRKGLLLGRESHRVLGLEEGDESNLLSAFASRYYLGRGEVGLRDLPSEILFPDPFDDLALLEKVLAERAGRRVELRVPQRGDKRRLVELARTNARHLLEDAVLAGAGLDEAPGERAEGVLYDLQERLGLKVVPRLILCFDISHTGGTEVVASAVAFENGEPRKSLYRHMRIRGGWGNDDFRSMAEAVERVVRRRLEEGSPLPDLLVIDGGKGQLSAVLQVLQTLNAPEVAVCALAKREEEIFLPGGREPLHLSRRDPALKLLQRLRNEAHRFAVSYNRNLRSQRTIRSELGEIEGVGPARQRALLTRFGSVEGVRQASVEELASLPGLSRLLAERILAYLGEIPPTPPSTSGSAPERP
jgi:excinuclease ABC subunit C